ncbi:MAG: FG-GAP-like repeat-containing protein [Planctomycetota bacterium]|jgi:hypothetical protein
MKRNQIARMITLFVVAFAGSLGGAENLNGDKPAVSAVPGVVIDYITTRTQKYIGSPSIAILPDGTYVASHDIFGPKASFDQTRIFSSADRGKTWQQLTQFKGQFWSTLFVHKDTLYIIGTSRKWGNIVIRRSSDGGKTWTEPVDSDTGLLVKGKFHCAPVPVVVHKGRIWRAFEEQGWKALVISAPVDSDLLKAENWTASNRLSFESGGIVTKWLEGNVVVTPEGGLVNILRAKPKPAKAAMVRISPDGKKITFNPKDDVIDLPGGTKKFSIRYDKVSGRYWSLINLITDPGPLEVPSNKHRNTVALVCSKDLRNWEVRYIALSFMKGTHLTLTNNKFGFQYIDWLIEGGDIIFVSRTAWGWDTPSYHDANYLTFHRIKNFRRRKPDDEPVDSSKYFGQTGLERMKYNNPGLVVDLGVGLWGWPLPMDYDGDGDYDLVVSCSDKPYNGTYYFENQCGDVKMPVFKPGARIGRGYKNSQVSFVDGKARVLVPGMELVNFSNGGNFEKTVRLGDPVHKSKGRVRARQWKYCDYDGDGDMDLTVGIGDWTEYGWDNAFDSDGKWTKGPLHGYVYLVRNKGTTKEPVYAEPVKVMADGKAVDVYGMPSPSFADFDGDGDLDLLCGEFVDKFTYFENTGTRTRPKYAAGRLLTYHGKTLKMDLCMIVPVAIDWDKDGDVDVIVGQEDGRVAFMENTRKVVNGMPQFLPPVFFQQEAHDVKFGALVTPYSVDWDGDGDEDLICGNTAGYIGFIENLDGGNPPKWAAPKYLKANGKVIHIQAGYNGSIQGPCEAKWGYTTLSVADWDHDGLADIMVNSIWGEVLWYRNIGTRQKPQLAAAERIEVEWPGETPKPAWMWWQPKGKQLVTQWRTTPFIFDLNKDGLNDLVMLDHEGYLAFFERTGKDGKVKLLPGKRIFRDHNGETLRLNKRQAGGSGRRKICLADWDGDGIIDLLANSRNIDFFKGLTGDSQKFKNEGLLDDRLLAGHTTSPTVVDWDKNGIPYLLVGAEDGYFYYMKNPRAASGGR